MEEGELLEMKSLGIVCGLRKVDQVRSDGFRERCGKKKSMIEGGEEVLLKWVGLVERVNKERLTKSLYVAEVKGTRGIGRSNWR